MKILRIPLIPLAAGFGVATAAGALGSRYLNGNKPDELDGFTKDELYERAQAADIPGRSGMTKDELLRALRSAG